MQWGSIFFICALAKLWHFKANTLRVCLKPPEQHVLQDLKDQVIVFCLFLPWWFCQKLFTQLASYCILFIVYFDLKVRLIVRSDDHRGRRVKMPWSRLSGSISSPKVDVAIDMGSPFLNVTLDGFLKIGTVIIFFFLSRYS